MYDDLDKLINSIKSHRIRYICLIILLGISIPLFIQILYWIGHYKILINTDFKASDILSFSGSFLAFIATTTLGVLALWQNKIIRDKASSENAILQQQNERLRNQDIERYELEVVSKYYSSIMFCDKVLIRTSMLTMLTEENREKGNEIVLYKKDDFDGRCFNTIEVRFYLKLLNYNIPKSARIESIALHYNGCYRKYEDNSIIGGDILNLYHRKEYFSPLSFNQDNIFKLSATFCIDKVPNESDTRDYIMTKSNERVKKIHESTKIFMQIDLSVKNPFDIITTASYIIELKSTNEIDDNKFLKFEIEDITMQLAVLDKVRV